MAFVKKTWKDRIVQYANRRLLTKSGGEVEQVTVTRDEGTISEAGDQFNASNMNNLEQRVKDGFDDVDTALSGKVNTGACVPFALDYPSSITGLVKYANGCYYNPQTNEVHINIVIYSNQNNIPNNGGVIATIPSAYRPSAERVVASFADIMDGTNALHFEAIQPIGTNGEIKLHNFVYAGNINTICMNFVYYK